MKPVEGQADPRHGARLARLGLEAIAGDEAGQDAMAPPTQPVDELNDRIGAACPPPIGDELEHGERHAAAAPDDPRAPSPISSS
jgi:hypothetical protein